VFGWNDVGYSITIIDPAHGAEADSFSAYTPVMSPDRHWIAARHFYPPQTEFRISEEYLLYDLNSSAEKNRHGVTPYTSDTAGWAMYPAFPDGAPADLPDMPEANAHDWRSKSFFWASDSRSLVFADRVSQDLSLVLILTTDGKPQAYVRPVSATEICAGVLRGAPYLILGDADVSSGSGGKPVAVLARFEDPGPGNGGTCQPQQLNFGFEEFRLAETEVYEHRKLKESTPKQPAQ